MPRYSLIAARDGDLISETSDHPDYESASRWAERRIVESFGLGWIAYSDLDELAAETDGIELAELEPNPVEEAAIAMLRASSLLSYRLASYSELWRDERTRDFLVASSRLAAVLNAEGNEPDRIKWP